MCRFKSVHHPEDKLYLQAHVKVGSLVEFPSAAHMQTLHYASTLTTT